MEYKTVLNVANDFSSVVWNRRRKDGTTSGQELLEDRILPVLNAMAMMRRENPNDTLKIDFRGARFSVKALYEVFFRIGLLGADVVELVELEGGNDAEMEYVRDARDFMKIGVIAKEELA